MPILHLLNGPGKGRSFEITSKSLFIGRDTDNDIQVQDPSVSRKHAKVFQKDSKVFIEDLRSQNGTWIDGAALKSGESYELAEGLPAAVGNILICVGEACIKDAVRREYSVDLSWHFAQQADEGLESDTLLTDRRKLEQLYHLLSRSGTPQGLKRPAPRLWILFSSSSKESTAGPSCWSMKKAKN